jgi:hypothetical protein
LSGEPQKQPDPIFFLDRTHGKHTRKLLERVGIAIVHHNDFYAQDTKDTVWLKRCGEDNWIVLTGDKEIERVPENRQAAIDAKCKVFFFNDTNSRGEEWAAAVIVGRKRLFEIIDKNNGPLFVTIDKSARSHISQARFAGDGGPKPVLAAVQTSPSSDQPQPTPPTPEHSAQQKEIEFPLPT